MPRFSLALLLAAVAAAALAVPAAGQNPAAKKDPPKPAPKKPAAKKDATPAADLAALPGFRVELVHGSDATAEGSWINLCKDGRGRLIVSGQRGQPVLRFTLSGGKVTKTEKLDVPFSEAMGLLWAFDHLYVNANGPKGFGLYRCTEAGDTGKFAAEFLKGFDGSGEHGPHGLALGPDDKIYVMNGNHTKLPAGLAPTSPHRNFAEDQLLPRQWDGNGHAAGILAPGGHVLRTDRDGKTWELVLAGFRNAYDLAFNADGELFTFDSDMEWDWGMPWYRPTRVNHCVSGAEFGWRSGTGKWPAYYPDSLPATLDIGIGSPTGVTNGLGAKFPEKYQKALYILDWSYGRLLAVHLTPAGSSYTATFENLVAPRALVEGKGDKKPLNLTDAVVGPDGALYFTTGGRNTASGLYRVTYVGDESTAPAAVHDAAGADARKLRHELEAFHGQADPHAVGTAWPHLGSPDRFVRSAARTAVESQPVGEWKGRALAETEPQAALTALLALARYGDAPAQAELLAALDRFPLASLSPALRLEKLRVLGVCFARHGRPAAAAVKKVVADVDGLFPAADELFNREAAEVLIFLNAPSALPKCLALMGRAKTQEDRIHYLFHLRTLPIGFWTLGQRKEYLAYFTKDRGKMAHPPETLRWFAEAGQRYGDGASFPNFLKNFLREYVQNLSDAERTALAPEIAAIDAKATQVVQSKPRQFVREYKLDEVSAQLDKVGRGRNFENGKQAFADAQCAKCHRVGDLGGAVGPELTAVGARYDRRTVLESILEPSKVVSDQYQNETFVDAGGVTVTGRLVDETPAAIWVQPDPLDPKRILIQKGNLDSRKPSPVSPMPSNLVDVLGPDDVLDLLAFLESGGNKGYKAFGK